MFKKYLVVAILVTTTFIAVLPIIPRMAWAANQRLLITEIKIGGGDEPKEFVEIFNDSDSPLSLDGMVIEYVKNGFPPEQCNNNSWLALGSSFASSKSLSGILQARSFHVVTLSLTDNTTGSVRLIHNTGPTVTEYDRVGWGIVMGIPAPCYQTQPATSPTAGKSIKRAFDATGHPVVASPASNLADFSLGDTPSPGNAECSTSSCSPGPGPNLLPPLITELLPDPGSPKLDSQDEYIELYNPNNEVFNLDGYSLFTGTSTNTYSKTLAGHTIQPKGYLVLYSKDTNLSLVNTSPASAWLVGPNQTRVSETPTYPSTIGTDQAWALINGAWQLTTTLTPGADNATSTDPEETGTEQNSSTTLAACPTGKYRNPETNRCKSLTTTASTLSPCKPGQERNPDTNRCRSAVLATGYLSPCQEGYERNPETNRCRKIAAVKGVATNQPSSAAKTSRTNMLLITFMSGAVALYGIYEYRKDLKLLCIRLAGRLGRHGK